MEQQFSEEPAAQSIYEPPVALSVQQEAVTITPNQTSSALPQSVESILAALEEDNQKRKSKKMNYVLFCSVLSFSLMLGLPIIALLIGGRAYGHLFLSTPSLRLLPFLSLPFFVAGWFLQIRNAPQDITKLEDIRCLGILLEIWLPLNYSKVTRRQAQQTLIKILTGVKASDTELLSEENRLYLRYVLDNNGYISFGKYYDAEILVAIMKAMAQVGDWKSEPMVRRLANSAKQEKVREAARECLPYLEPLAAKQRVGEELLRASSADATADQTDTLLRPSGGVNTTPPEMLLRAEKKQDR